MNTWREMSWFVWWKWAGVHLSLPFNQNQPLNAANGAATQLSLSSINIHQFNQPIQQKPNFFGLLLMGVDWWLMKRESWLRSAWPPAAPFALRQLVSFILQIHSTNQLNRSIVGGSEPHSLNKSMKFICFVNCSSRHQREIHQQSIPQQSPIIEQWLFSGLHQLLL